MILAATGHRPGKLFPGRPTPDRNYWIRKLLPFAVEQLERHQPDRVISGMALGWDQAVAVAAYVLNIPYVAAVPFKGQEERWSEIDRHGYEIILSNAASVEVVCNHRLNIAFQKRNEYMVDHADQLLALWDGSSGGTRNCLHYNDKTWLLPVDNVWSRWTQEIRRHGG